MQYKKLFPKKIDEIDCECGEKAKIQLPSSVHATNYEMKDASRGVQLPKGQAEQLKKRMHDHHNKYEIERKVDEFGIADSLRDGTIKKIKKI